MFDALQLVVDLYTQTYMALRDRFGILGALAATTVVVSALVTLVVLILLWLT